MRTCRSKIVWCQHTQMKMKSSPCCDACNIELERAKGRARGHGL